MKTIISTQRIVFYRYINKTKNKYYETNAFIHNNNHIIYFNNYINNIIYLGKYSEIIIIAISKL